MDREHWKKMLPFITAFANGETVTNAKGEPFGEDLGFDLPPEYYRIAKPKQRVPLEAEDWIKDGPWWFRVHEEDTLPTMVLKAGSNSIAWFGGERTHVDAMKGQRRNAASDWMPCWKEKE